MSKRWLLFVVSVFVLGLFFQACSKSEDVEPETGKVEEFVDKTATQIEKKIQTPLDKARQTQSLGDDRLKAMDEALRKK